MGGVTMGVTVARTRCAGCRTTTGFNLWPWSGRIFVTSHTICSRCLQQMRPARAGATP